MYIDFHTHAFADKIAKSAMDFLCSTLQNEVKAPDPQTNGTVSDLLAKMDLWGVDKSVVLPIATKPTQQKIINDFAHENSSDRLIFFGTVHPKADDWESELERIKSLGLYGVKLHPDYQGFYANDEELFPIYEKCAELSLPVILHAGYDALSPKDIHCTPKMSLDVIKRVPKLKLILAHLGGERLWDDVEKYLVGEDVFFDTAFTYGEISTEQALRIIKNHGADKILFGSDAPWHKSPDEISLIDELDLTNEEKEMIFYKNAENLLLI